MPSPKSETSFKPVFGSDAQGNITSAGARVDHISKEGSFSAGTTKESGPSGSCSFFGSVEKNFESKFSDSTTIGLKGEVDTAGNFKAGFSASFEF